MSKRTQSNTVPTTLRIRMYRVGFGDFFLVTVPSQDGPQHIVIDCGVTRGKSGKGDIATIKTAVRHMAKETKGKLALIIVTHRHQDHIIGFSRCAAEFEPFVVDAIWMPSWETEYPDVKKLDMQKFQQDLEAVALGLRAAALAGDHDAYTDEILGIVENATGLSLTEGPGGGTNAQSLAILKHRLRVKPDYYHYGDEPKLPAGLVQAGLSAQILGPPPPDDLAFLQLNDLKKGVAQYLGAAGASTDPRQSQLMPFAPQFIGSVDEYPSSAFREWAPREPGVLPDFSQRYPERLESAVRAATPEALFMAAKKLDGMLNNQSLVVLFTWQGKKLLFAGDAQAGNWEYWLYDLASPMKDPSGETLAQAGQSILGSLDFYKVGHHGSTNATPISAVEAMGQDFVAMCSVEDGTFGSVANKSEVPRVPLLTALARKSTVVRSDQFPVAVDEVQVAAATKGKRPVPKRGKLVVGSCYVDYYL